jgi:hypothetical protein
MPSKKKIRSDLNAALHDLHMVRVDRLPKFADNLNGFVVAVGAKWVLLAQSTDGGFFSGYVAFRLDDVKRVRRDTTFETAFAKTQPEWPPADPFNIGLDSTKEVLEGLGSAGALIGIQKYNERSAIWIGTLDEVRKRYVYLNEVRPDATWLTAPLGYRLKAITTVDVATHYLQGLAAIAGTRPSANQ